jgi:hypothetical protein
LAKFTVPGMAKDRGFFAAALPVVPVPTVPVPVMPGVLAVFGALVLPAPVTEVLALPLELGLPPEFVICENTERDIKQI